MLRYVPFPKYEKLVRRLRKLIRRGSAVERRDALAVVVGLHGLRVTEVINLTVGDLDRIDGSLHVRTLKKGKPRRVALGPGVLPELRRLAAKRGKEAPLFTTTTTGGPVHESQWQRFARDLTTTVLGETGLKFHAMRHTFAMRLYAQTRDMQRVKARLGHRKLDSTQVYVDAWGDLDDREIAKLGRIEALPDLKGARGSGLGAGGKKSRRGERTASSSRVPSPESPAPRSSVTVGCNRRKKRDIPREPSEKPSFARGKNGKSADHSPKATSGGLTRETFAEWKAGILKDLAKQGEAFRVVG